MKKFNLRNLSSRLSIITIICMLSACSAYGLMDGGQGDNFVRHDDCVKDINERLHTDCFVNTSQLESHRYEGVRKKLINSRSDNLKYEEINECITNPETALTEECLSQFKAKKPN